MHSTTLETQIHLLGMAMTMILMPYKIQLLMSFKMLKIYLCRVTQLDPLKMAKMEQMLKWAPVGFR